MRELLRKYRLSFALYFLVGGICALVEWGVFFFGNVQLKQDFWLSAVEAFIIATYVNYLLSANFVFKHRRSAVWYRELVLVYGASLIAFIPNFVITWGMIQTGLMSVMVAKIAGTGFGFILNYGLRQFKIFSREPRWK